MKSMFFLVRLAEFAMQTGTSLSMADARRVFQWAGVSDIAQFDATYPGAADDTLLIDNGRPTELFNNAEPADDDGADVPCSDAQASLIMEFMGKALDAGTPLTVRALAFMVYQTQGLVTGLTERPVFADEIHAAAYGPSTAAIQAEFGADPDAEVVTAADGAAWAEHRDAVLARQAADIAPAAT